MGKSILLKIYDFLIEHVGKKIITLLVLTSILEGFLMCLRQGINLIIWISNLE